MRFFSRIIIGCLLLSFMLPVFNASAQNPAENAPIWLSISDQNNPGSDPTTQVGTVIGNSLDVTITFPGFWAEVESKNGEDYTRIWHDEFGSYREPGKPALPGKAFNVLVPNGVQVEVVNQTIRSKTIALSDYTLPSKIMPAQIQAAKSEPAPPWTAPDPKQYRSRDPFPQAWFELKNTFQMRDYTIQPIWVNPVRYIAVDGQIEILEKMDLRLSWQESELGTALSQLVSDSPSFDQLVSQIVINPPESTVFDTKEDTGEGYLIITPDEFALALTDFVSMKDSQGYDVQVTKLSEIDGLDGGQGDVLLIQNHIKSFNPLPVYLLLVGDTNLIPAPEGDITKLKTDLYYATLDEPVNGVPDFVPDIHIGRLPARSVEDISTMVNKLIAYNINGFQDYYINASFIATCDTKINSELGLPNFQIAEGSHNFVINHYTSLLNYPGDYPDDLFPFGGDQLYCITNDADTSDITPRISEGRGLLTYSGHGWVTGWAESEISISRDLIPIITEENKYSFVSSFACNTNDFGNDDSRFISVFGETWMLQPNKGAIGFFGSAAPSYWNQDNILEITMFEHLYSDPLNPPSIREAINVGLLALEEEYLFQDLGGFQYYLESYNLLGDPSQKLWLYPDDPYYFITQVAVDEQNGFVGSTVDYPINLINYGEADNYTIEISNNLWPVTAVNVIDISTKTSMPITISVQIPLSATTHDSDQVQVTITSQNSSQSTTITLTTTAKATFFTHLPLISN